MGPVGGCSRKRHTWRCTAARGRALPASRRRRAAHPYPDPNPIRARTLQRQEDGEGPLVDGEDAVERGGEHKRGHHHLVEVHLAVAHGRRRGAGAGPLVGRTQLGGHHPLVGLLQVQDACTRARAYQALPSSTRCLLPLYCLALQASIGRLAPAGGAGRPATPRGVQGRLGSAAAGGRVGGGSPATHAHSFTMPIAFSKSTYRMQCSQPCRARAPPSVCAAGPRHRLAP